MITLYLHRNPQMVWLVIAAIVLAGVASLSVMPRLEDPILNQRVAVITTSLVGADASEIESTVVRAMEEWLSEFSEIKQVRSNTRANVANIVIELADHVSQPGVVWSAIERRFQTNFSLLPNGCTEPELTVFPLKAYAAILAIVPEEKPKSDTLQQEVRLARELKSRLLALRGTESIELFGAPIEELVVEINLETLAATGLSIGLIAQQISESQAIPGGNMQRDGRQLSVEVRETEDLIERLEQIAIQIPGQQQSIRLADLCSVSLREQTPPTDLAIIDRRQAIVLAAMVNNQSRVDLWTTELRNEIRQFSTDFPGAYSIDPLFLQSDQVQQRMDNLLQNLMISTVAVVLIVFLFMGWRCMLVVAVSLPLSACLVVCGLRFCSIPIHQMSVTGLIVSLGLLIDNAIVMVEEVRTRVFQGKSSVKAISESIRHLALPLLGSTLTTVLCFLPIATMPGPSGEFVGSLAVSVILAISASLLLALTVIPPMVFLLGVNAEKAGFFDYGVRLGFIQSLYRKSLEITFRWPVLGAVLGLILPGLGFYVAGQLPKQFFPATDRAQIQIELELPGSSNLIAVQKSVAEVMSIVESNDFVSDQHWFLGRSAPTFYYNVVPRRKSAENYAQAFVDLQGQHEIDDLVNRLQTEIDSQVHDARVVVRKLEQGPPFDAPIEIRILGDDLGILEDLGNQLRQVLASHTQVTHTRSDLGDKASKLELEVDSNIAQRNRLSERDISRFLRASLQGVDAGTFYYRGLPVPARIEVNYSDRSVLNSLLAMPIPVKREPANLPPQSNNSVIPPRSGPTAISLGAIGDFALNSDVGAIVRLDGQRVNEVKAYLRAGVLPAEALADIKENLRGSDFRLPLGYRIEFGGEAEKRSEAISTLIANIVIIFALMALTLVAVLGSVRFALIIASVAGLAIGLGPLALHFFGYPLGFMAIVGTMGLIGVAINDSIVVLAAIRARYRPPGGAPSEEDSGEQVPADRAQRLSGVVLGSTRHILATTLTTMIGFLPLVIDGGKFWPPLAIVISAGVAGATLLALFFTPSLYLLFHRDGKTESVPQTD